MITEKTLETGKLTFMQKTNRENEPSAVPLPKKMLVANALTCALTTNSQ